MTQTIPKAKAPEGKNFLYHLQATNDDLLGYLEHLASYGDIAQLSILPAYLVNSPQLVQQVLVTKSKSFHKPTNIKNTVERILGTQNLFSSDGDVWQVLRKSVQPAFHMKRINAYLDLIINSTEARMATWGDGDLLDFPVELMDLTMSISSQVLFGHELEDMKSGQAIIDFLDVFSDRITNPIPVPTWLPLASNRKMKEALQTADNLLLPIIEKRRESGEDTGDILSMLLEAQRKDDTGILTDLQLRIEVYNLFAAGYEVTGNTTAFTMYLISQHPEVEKRLVAEIDEALAGDKTLSLEALARMPYLEQVIKESMRILPITALVSRTAIEDVLIEDYHIPKNSQVLVAPWTLHRRADIFSEPLKFDPDRFSPEREKDIPKNAYIPFSTGPRVCIGNAFAMLQMRSTLALMLRNYHFELSEDYVFEPYWRFNTQLKNGLPLTIRAR